MVNLWPIHGVTAARTETVLIGQQGVELVGGDAVQTLAFAGGNLLTVTVSRVAGAAIGALLLTMSAAVGGNLLAVGGVVSAVLGCSLFGVTVGHYT